MFVYRQFGYGFISICFLLGSYADLMSSLSGLAGGKNNWGITRDGRCEYIIR